MPNSPALPSHARVPAFALISPQVLLAATFLVLCPLVQAQSESQEPTNGSVAALA